MGDIPDVRRTINEQENYLKQYVFGNRCHAICCAGETSLPAQVFNVDENTKVNTTIGTIRFLDGVSDKTVRLEVGTTDIKNWTTNGEAFEPIAFKSTFAQAPIVFGQIQSNSDYQVEYEVNTYSYSGVTSKNNNQLLMRHRLDNVTALGFDAVLESELDKKAPALSKASLILVKAKH